MTPSLFALGVAAYLLVGLMMTKATLFLIAKRPEAGEWIPWLKGKTPFAIGNTVVGWPILAVAAIVWSLGKVFELLGAAVTLGCPKPIH